MRRKIVSAVVGLLAASRLFGQNGPDNDPVGLRGLANGTFDTSQPDSINLMNGQLAVPIPIGPSYPIGPNLRFQAVLTYNSRVWELGRPSTQQSYLTTPVTGNPALGIGWDFNLGAIKLCSGSTVYCYSGPDGGQHIFDEADAKRGSGFWKSSDGARLSLKNNGSSGFEMWDEVGNHYVFDTTGHVTGYDDPVTNLTHDFGRGRDGWYLTKLEDPFHNNYTISYFGNSSSDSNSPCTPVTPPGIWQYTGTPLTSGKMQCPDYVAAPKTWIPSTITIPNGTGGTQNITLTLDSYNRIWKFQFPVFSGPTTDWTLVYGTAQAFSNPSSGALNLETLSSISFPAGIGGSPSYAFSYYADGCPPGVNGPDGPSGLLKQVTLPGTATVDYVYRRYAFFHTHKTRFGPGCTVISIPANTTVAGNDLIICSSCTGSPIRQPNLTTEPCDSSNPDAYLDQDVIGVGRRTLTVSGIASTTDYYQYSFPFGECGTAPPANCTILNKCAESMTLIVYPEVDLNGQASGQTPPLGRRGSRALVFVAASDGVSGKTEGAPIEERYYDHDVSISEPSTCPMPPSPFTTPCGTGADKAFCSQNAVRTIRRTFAYGDDVFSDASRRLQSQTTYYQATDSSGNCASCPYHTVSFSNSGTRIWDNSTTNSNGRHYNIETHAGSLGSDARTITATWAPQITSSVYLPDILTERKDILGSSTDDRFFDFNTTTGFLNGSLIWDSTNQMVWANCRFTSTGGPGNVLQELTKTFGSSTAPSPTYCSTNFGTTSMPSVGTGQDMFGQNYAYQNGELTSATWVSDMAPVAWSRFSLTRDSRTGWVTDAADTAGASTHYAYDGIGRPTSITPPGESTFSIAYTLTQTTAQRTGSSISTYEELDYDTAGRLLKQRRRIPGGMSGTYVKRFFTYDARGTQNFASEWVSDTTGESVSPDLGTTCSFSGGTFSTKRPSAAPGTYSLCFDPFGRPQQTVGSKFSSLVTADRTNGVTVYYSDTKDATTVACVGGTLDTMGGCTGGANATTTTVRDAYGRSTSVTEPTGDVTSYTYDVDANLTGVTAGSQTRSFTYFTFGFLKSETTPEKGTVDYTYGSLGNLLTATEPGSLLTQRCYDPAGRVVSVRSNETGTPDCTVAGSGRTYAAYAYDGSPGVGNLSNGKMTTRQGFNFPFGKQAPVYEIVTYGGVGGRISRIDTTVGQAVFNFEMGEGYPFSRSWTYNSLGLVATATRASGVVETPAYDANAAYPTSETAIGQTVFSGVTYAPAGTISGWTAGNSVATTIGQDSSSLPRPSSISTTGASPNFSSGAYAYDGAGNILSIGATPNKDTFTYDSLARLTSASYYNSGLGSQYYCYDRYGNRVSKSTTTSTCSGTVWSDNKVPAGNGITYDITGRGNVVVNGATSLIYDGLNREVREFASGGADWEYLYDGGGERIAKVPSGAILERREMARYVVQARGEGPSTLGCSGSNSHYFTDVLCSDPDAHWIDQFRFDGITTGCSGTTFCPEQPVTRATMAAFLVVGLGQTPLTVCPVPMTFTDVHCGDFAWGSIEKIAQMGITAGCGGGNYCPTSNVTEGQILGFMQAAAAWPSYMPIPRGTVYTFRDLDGRLVTEEASYAGTVTTNPPVATVATRENVFLGNLLAGSKVTSTLGGTLGWNWYHEDHLGSPRIVTNASATTVETWKYWPYGDEAISTSTSERLRFAGMERDQESVHYFDHARNEDFNLGRFMTPDPLQGGFGPQGWNRYAYVLGNPLALVDPFGLDPLPTGCHWDNGEMSCVVPVNGTPVPADPIVIWASDNSGLADSSFGSQGGATSPSKPCPGGPQNVNQFIRDHRADARTLEAQSGVQSDYFLGKSGWESRWGANRFAAKGNNFFSLHGGADAPFANGSMQALRPLRPGIKPATLSTFPSYLASGQSFLAQYGAGLALAQTPEEFARQLIRNHYNSGNAANGGDPNFIANTVTGIQMVQRRSGC